MVLSARGVNVAVLKFFRCGRTNVHDLYLEVKINASKRMISVDSDRILIHLRYSHGLSTIGAEPHAGPNFLTAKGRLRHLLNKLRIKFPIAFFGCHTDVKLLALLSAFEAFFHARDQVANALNVVQRIATFT